MAPKYLRHLVPPTIQSTTIYPLRNGDNLIVPFCRLSITNSSFIPSTVGYIVVLWIVGGTRWRKYLGAIPYFILKNNWSYLRYLRSDSVSQQSTTIYPLRNGDNLIVPFCRLSITNSSFIPSTVKEWNKFDIAIRKLDSLSKFKNAIRLNSQQVFGCHSTFYIKK
jgi:hypothetical protein